MKEVSGARSPREGSHGTQGRDGWSQGGTCLEEERSDQDGINRLIEQDLGWDFIGLLPMIRYFSVNLFTLILKVM
jgi:hypothetical protein